MKKLLALVLVTMMALSCFSFAMAQEKPIVLNIGILDGWTGFVTKYIVDQGLDLANGIDIEYLVFSSGPPANEAMIAGDLDCAILGGGATVPALANLDFKMIMETNNDTIGMSLIARPELDCASVSGAVEGLEIFGSAESLRGKSILTTAGALQYYVAIKYLEAIGLTTEDVTLISMDANQAYQAFMLGEGDILCCSNNYSFDLVDKGYVELASLTSLNCAASAQLVCSDDAFNNTQKVEALTIFVKILAGANDLMNSDLELATESYVNWVHLNGGTVSEDTARKIMSQQPYYGVEDMMTRDFGYDLLNNFVSFYLMAGQIEDEQVAGIAANVRDDILVLAGLK